jgi:hypothetical protein
VDSKAASPAPATSAARRRARARGRWWLAWDASGPLLVTARPRRTDLETAARRPQGAALLRLGRPRARRRLPAAKNGDGEGSGLALGQPSWASGEPRAQASASRTAASRTPTAARRPQGAALLRLERDAPGLAQGGPGNEDDLPAAKDSDGKGSGLALEQLSWARFRAAGSGRARPRGRSVARRRREHRRSPTSHGGSSCGATRPSRISDIAQSLVAWSDETHPHLRHRTEPRRAERQDAPASPTSHEGSSPGDKTLAGLGHRRRASRLSDPLRARRGGGRSTTGRGRPRSYGGGARVGATGAAGDVARDRVNPGP